MESGILEVDKQMSVFYKTMFNLDISELYPIKTPVKNLEININERRIPLLNFLKGKIRTVSLDNFSTRDLNEQAILESGMSEFQAEVCMNLYMELQRRWGVIEHDSKIIGIADALSIYNGFPNFADPEEFAKNPIEYYKKVFLTAMQNPSRTFGVKPKIYARTYLGFQKKFIDKNPIYDKTEEKESNSKFFDFLRIRKNKK